MSIHLNDYHKAVIDHLKSVLPWAKSIEAYPETRTAFDTPCLFFQVEDFERAEVQPMNSKLAVTLQCEIVAVLGIDDIAFQKEVRNAAMSLALQIDCCRFGLAAKEAKFLSAAPAAFEPELDGYAAWSIRFEQDIEIGTDEYAPNLDDVIPHTVHTGFCPEIGKEHVDDYEQVVPVNEIEPR